MKTMCDMCGKPWLGDYYGAPLCNDCRVAQLEDDALKHREAPSEVEIDAMFDTIVGSDSKEYRIAHE